MSEHTPVTFVVAGQRLGATRGTSSLGGTERAPGRLGRSKDFVSLGAQRSTGASTRITAVPEEDVVVLHITNGPALVLHPQVAHELLLAQVGGETRSRSSGAGADEVEVPAQLRWAGAAPDGAPTRGPIGDILLSAIEIVTDLHVEKAAALAADGLAKLVDGHVEPGLYRLSPDALTALKGSGQPLREGELAASDGVSLVLIHGTFSDTAGSFGKLWSLHGRRVRQLFEHHEGRVYGLDHPTLGRSPIDNALLLAAALPERARLHLLTHSRGGLVAEVLARVCANPQLTDADLPAGDDGVALRALAAIVVRKNLKVERVVRVACPARGTLLASKRLDAYLSVLKWLLELASVPVAPGLVDFLGQVALRRTEPEALPGLAAMMPDSPLVKWLHAAEEPIAGELRVVAGDVRASSVMGWLKILVSDWFYWTDNDLVVQTRSMYGGSPREAGASFVLDAGGDVSHFNYFKHERSVQVIVDGLLLPEPQGYRPIGPLSWAGKSAGGVRAAQRPSSKPASDVPAVVLLPGILGSHLKVADKRIWLSLRIVGGLHRLAFVEGDAVAPDGPIGSSYDELIAYLATSHEVIPFAYDWRRKLEDEAKRLADVIDGALRARSGSQQPVRIIAHSMGGLLARTMWLERRGVWEQMMKRPGARLLMLGTPNDGSWAPMQVLSGDDGFGNTLTGFGAPFREHAARQLMAAMPGFLQLQAGLLDGQLKLDRRETWQHLADEDIEYLKAKHRWHASELQLQSQRWGVPPQDVLDAATHLRKRLNAQQFGDYSGSVALVVGRAPRTAAGFSVDDAGFEYIDDLATGDGRVTLAAARLPGVRTWTLDASHGDLPRERGAFDGFRELLERGDTERLDRLVPGVAARSGDAAATAPQQARSRPARARDTFVTPPEQTRDAFELPGLPPMASSEAFDLPLRVTVLNGDLILVSEPLLIGHYRSAALSGAEGVVDKLIGRTMSRSLQLGQYPDLPGSHQIFVNLQGDDENPWKKPCPEAVIVVGLGEETMLTPAELTRSVRQGVIAWSQRQTERATVTPVHLTLAATLIGSGGSGISAGAAARAVALGVRAANAQLATVQWPVVSHLILAELFLDRATAAWQELAMLASSAPGQLDLVSPIKLGNGALPRPLEADYRGVDNDLITVQSNDDGVLSYTLDTRRARSEVSAQFTQVALLRKLVASASNEGNRDPSIGRTLFQLLVPEKLEPFLTTRGKMMLELDHGAAAIPWELLDVRDERQPSDEPWAIRSRLLRKLRTANYRQHVRDAQAEDRVLIIGEPQCDAKRYARLPGALEEARAVETQLRQSGGLELSERVHTVFNADAQTVIGALFEHRYRVVHIAGHGVTGKTSGVVLSDDVFLSAREIEAMRTVPELVFVNCCYLAARDESGLLLPVAYDRAEFAANVADALIKIGVRCVIAAGWAVGDAAANQFALAFYKAILANRPFGDAVYEARKAARAAAPGDNTWAAYQCYGDSDWTFRSSGTARASSGLERDEFAYIASGEALILALKTLEVETRFQGRERSTQLERLRYLDKRYRSSWPNGAVAERFAAAYAALGDQAIDAAISWYEQAVQMEDGGASQRAEEQLYNLRVRRAVANTDRAALRHATEYLEALAERYPTVERYTLCGSAEKRNVMLLEAAEERQAALGRMRAWYTKAHDLAFSRGDADAFYPGLNCLAIALVAREVLDRETVERVKGSLFKKLEDQPDFWSKVGHIELTLYELLASGTDPAAIRSLRISFEDLKQRVAAAWMWSSVRDQTQFLLNGLKLAGYEHSACLDALAELHSQLSGYASH